MFRGLYLGPFSGKNVPWAMLSLEDHVVLRLDLCAMERPRKLPTGLRQAGRESYEWIALRGAFRHWDVSGWGRAAAEGVAPGGRGGERRPGMRHRPSRPASACGRACAPREPRCRGGRAACARRSGGSCRCPRGAAAPRCPRAGCTRPPRERCAASPLPATSAACPASARSRRRRHSGGEQRPAPLERG